MLRTPVVKFFIYTWIIYQFHVLFDKYPCSIKLNDIFLWITISAMKFPFHWIFYWICLNPLIFFSIFVQSIPNKRWCFRFISQIITSENVNNNIMIIGWITLYDMFSPWIKLLKIKHCLSSIYKFKQSNHFVIIEV